MITRRQLLITAAGGITTLVTAELRAPSANASLGKSVTETVTASASSESRVECFTNNYLRRSSIAYPGLIDISGLNGKQADLSLSFDSRLFEPATSVLISAGDDYFVSETNVSSSGGDLSTMRFDMPVFGDDTTVFIVNVPLTPKNNYPNDNVESPNPVTLELVTSASSDSLSSSWTASDLGASSAVWGAELAAGWDTVDLNSGVAAGLKYRFPSSVRIKSVGPSAVPSSAILLVEVDASIISSLTADRVVLGGVDQTPDAFAVSIERRGPGFQVEVTLLREIPAGAELTIYFGAVAVSQPSLNTSVRYASAKLTSREIAGVFQRNTSAYSVNDLTSSGNPQVPDTAEGTI